MDITTDFEASSTCYRTIVTDLLKQLKQRGSDQAEILISDEAGYSIDVRDGAVDTLQHEHDVGIDITVYRDGCTASVSTTSISSAALSVAMDKVMSMVQFTEKDPYLGLADPSVLAYNYPNLDLYHPCELTPADAIEQLVACDRTLRGEDHRILPAEGVAMTTYNSYRVYANSHDFFGDYRSSYHDLVCSAVIRDGDDMETYVDSTSACRWTDLQDPHTLAKTVASKAASRLGARSLPTQTCPVLFSPSMSKSLLRSFLQAISGSAQYRKTSFLAGQLGRTVFPEWLSMAQDPHALAKPYSAPFDHDGVRTESRHYVEDGVLTSYVLDAYAARKLQMAPTGNSGGVFNLSVNSTGQDLAELCRLMGKGLLVTELMGQGTNIVSGNYSRGAAGFWVEHGEIQFPVSEVTIAGNLADMFQQLVAVGSDCDYRGRIHTGSFLVEAMTIAGS